MQFFLMTQSNGSRGIPTNLRLFINNDTQVGIWRMGVFHKGVRLTMRGSRRGSSLKVKLGRTLKWV